VNTHEKFSFFFFSFFFILFSIFFHSLFIQPCVGLFWVCTGHFWVCIGLFWGCIGLFWVCIGLFGVCFLSIKPCIFLCDIFNNFLKEPCMFSSKTDTAVCKTVVFLATSKFSKSLPLREVLLYLLKTRVESRSYDVSLIRCRIQVHWLLVLTNQKGCYCDRLSPQRSHQRLQSMKIVGKTI